MKIGTRIAAIVSSALLLTPSAGLAELVLDQVIVDIEADQRPRSDIEVSNSGTETMYIVVEPYEILNPGLENEKRVQLENPALSRVFVSPRKVILQPGERSLIRIVGLGDRPQQDRVFRLTIRPVVGDLNSEEDAIKVLVGYDALVLLRADKELGEVVGIRTGQKLVLENRSNSAREFFDGTQCDSTGNECQPLPSKRLYPKQSFVVNLPYDTEAKYQTAVGGKIDTRSY